MSRGLVSGSLGQHSQRSFIGPFAGPASVRAAELHGYEPPWRDHAQDAILPSRARFGPQRARTNGGTWRQIDKIRGDHRSTRRRAARRMK